MAKHYLLTYDASVDWHYDRDVDFRKSLVEFLIIQGADVLDSCVSSTIYFTRPDEPQVSTATLSNRIRREFGGQFNFVIVLIAINNDHEPIRHENPSRTIRQNFAGLVRRIRDQN